LDITDQDLIQAKQLRKSLTRLVTSQGISTQDCVYDVQAWTWYGTMVGRIEKDIEDKKAVEAEKFKKEQERAKQRNNKQAEKKLKKGKK